MNLPIYNGLNMPLTAKQDFPAAIPRNGGNNQLAAHANTCWQCPCAFMPANKQRKTV